MGTSAPKGRDRHGLLPQQRIVLQELLTAHSWEEAAQNAGGLTSRQLRRWMREDTAFAAAYDQLFDNDKGETIRKQIAASAAKAADTLDAALDATKGVSTEVTCPECGTQFSIDTSTPNWTARMRAAETMLKVGGQLKDVKKIEGEIVHMTLEHKLALAAIKAGRAEESIPSYILDDLRRMKALKSGEPAKQEAEEADWREIFEEESNETDPGS